MHRLLWPLCAGAALFAAPADDELLAAARKGDLAAVKAQIEMGAAVEAKTPYGQTPLYLAAMNGHEPVVEFLLTKGASTEVRDTFYKAPMLTFVLMRKHFGVAKLLVSKGGGNPDETLASVAATGNAELVQAAIDRGKLSAGAIDKAYEAALDQKQTAVAEALKRAGAKEPAPAVAIDVKVLESYEGTYKAAGFPIDIKVFVKEGKLFMQGSGQPEFAPKAKSATAFEFAPARIEVEFDTPGGFTFKQGGMTLAFKKAVAQ